MNQPQNQNNVISLTLNMNQNDNNNNNNENSNQEQELRNQIQNNNDLFADNANNNNHHHSNNHNTSQNIPNSNQNNHPPRNFVLIQRILALFDIYNASEGYYCLIHLLLKSFGIVICINITFLFNLSLLIFIICLVLKEVITIAKEINTLKGEE